jgi:hypothetical protein
MKVLITESQLNNTIEKLIRSINKDVVSVDFVDKKVGALSNETGRPIQYDKTVIKIVLDPHNILGGNLHYVVSTQYIHLRKEIKNALNKFLNINIDKFMSPYDIEFYVLGTTRV